MTVKGCRRSKHTTNDAYILLYTNEHCRCAQPETLVPGLHAGSATVAGQSCPERQCRRPSRELTEPLPYASTSGMRTGVSLVYGRAARLVRGLVVVKRGRITWRTYLSMSRPASGSSMTTSTPAVAA